MAGKEMVVIGCRIPNGLILAHPKTRARVTLEGPKLVMANPNPRKLSANFAITEVDAEFWAAWKAAYAKSPILTSQAIFEAKSESEANAKARELQKEKTGFEQMPQESMGVQKEAA